MYRYCPTRITSNLRIQKPLLGDQCTVESPVGGLRPDACDSPMYRSKEAIGKTVPGREFSPRGSSSLGLAFSKKVLCVSARGKAQPCNVLQNCFASLQKRECKG